MVAGVQGGALRSEERTSELQSHDNLVCLEFRRVLFRSDRKSTRLNSSHTIISYAGFCLNKHTDFEPRRFSAQGGRPGGAAGVVRSGGAPRGRGAVLLPRRPPPRAAPPCSSFFLKETPPPESSPLSRPEALPI